MRSDSQRKRSLKMAVRGWLLINPDFTQNPARLPLRHLHRFRPTSAIFTIKCLPQFDAEVDVWDNIGGIPSVVERLSELQVEVRLLQNTITLLVGCHFDAE